MDAAGQAHLPPQPLKSSSPAEHSTCGEHVDTQEQPLGRWTKGLTLAQAPVPEPIYFTLGFQLHWSVTGEVLAPPVATLLTFATAHRDGL